MDGVAGDVTGNFGEGDGGQVMPVIHCAAEAGAGLNSSISDRLISAVITCRTDRVDCTFNAILFVANKNIGDSEFLLHELVVIPTHISVISMKVFEMLFSGCQY